MRTIIIEGKHHVERLLGILDKHTTLQFDSMISAREYVESLDKWESLMKKEKNKKGESAWEKIGTFDLQAFIDEDDEEKGE